MQAKLEDSTWEGACAQGETRGLLGVKAPKYSDGGMSIGKVLRYVQYTLSQVHGYFGSVCALAIRAGTVDGRA